MGTNQGGSTHHVDNESPRRPGYTVELASCQPSSDGAGDLAGSDWRSGWGRESSAQPPRARNFVYVESNDPAGNAIFAFARNDANGSLMPLPGSPFPAGGSGITFTTALGPFDSDQEVIVNPQHTLLFAVNGGSDTIAVFNIQADER